MTCTFFPKSCAVCSSRDAMAFAGRDKLGTLRIWYDLPTLGVNVHTEGERNTRALAMVGKTNTLVNPAMILSVSASLDDKEHQTSIPAAVVQRPSGQHVVSSATSAHLAVVFAIADVCLSVSAQTVNLASVLMYASFHSRQ